MGDASRLVEAMRKAAKPKESETVDIVTGTVTSINPLKIKTDKLELTESFLILGALCKRTTIKIPNDTLAHTHTIPNSSTQTSLAGGTFPEVVLWRDLQVGDNVYMLRCGRGQKYYVLQRKEGIV